MVMSSNDTYFAADESDKLISVLMTKESHFNKTVHSSGYLEKLYKLYNMYYGTEFYGNTNGHEIQFEGEQGELASMSVNHLRNIGQNILTLITSSRPTMEATAINTDVQSKIQTKLANGLLDYYMREKKVDALLKSAVEMSLVQASAWIRIAWNASAGEQTGYDEELEIPIYEGDVEFSLVSPLDITFDNTKENSRDHDWLLVRTFKNKFDIAAKYPHLEEKIKQLQTKSEYEKDYMFVFGNNETNDIPVYEFFHRRSESMPDGRYMMYVSDDVMLHDTPLPYEEIPLYQVSPSDIMGTPFGYTPLFDLMPLQEAVNMLYSIILTNQQAFGVQNIYVPRGADISMESLMDGMNIIEGNQNAGKPEAMNFTQTPKEVFDYLSFLIQSMETISGINSVVRGQPEANLRSGSALALMQNNSIQFMSGLAQQYNQLIESVGIGMLKILKRYAETKRVAAIVGEQNRSYLQEFSKDDLSNINRVSVRSGNPLSKTNAGRMQMASELLQYGLLKDPKQYLNILETGNLDVAVEEDQKAANLITTENEMLLHGEMPMALELDEHMRHINSHKSILNDAKMRNNPELLKNVLAHVGEHLEILRTADPTLLAAIGEQSLAPMPDPNMGPAMNMPPGGDVANLSAPTGSPDPAQLPTPADQLPSMPEGTMTAEDIIPE